MSLYFYYYPSYGFSFIWAIQIVLIAAIIVAILAGMIFMALSVGEFWEIGAKQKSRVAGWIKAAIKKESIGVPFLFFPVFIYACSFIWILYIYKRSRDLSIVANDTYALIIITILAIIAFSLGSRILKLFKFKFSDWLERFLLSEAIGLGTLMMIMYALGMAHLYYCSVAYGLVGLIAIFTYREIFELWNFVKNNKVTWRTQPLMSFKNFLIVAIALMGGIYTAGMFQQYPLGWDASYVYAAFPKAFITNHGIVNAYYFFLSGFPKNGEMLLTLGMLITGTFTAMSGMNFIFLLLSGVSVFFVGREMFNKTTALLSTFFYMFFPIVADFNICDIKIDLFLVFYCTLSFVYLVKYINSSSRRYLILSAIFMGISGGIKYTFFYTILPSFLLVIMFSGKMQLKKKLQAMAIIVLFVFVLFSPWAVKNYIFSGNPIEPIAGDYLSEGNVFLKKISESYKKNSDAIISDGILYEDQEIKDWKYYLSFPFRIVFNIKSRHDRDILNSGLFGLLLVPLAIPFLIKGKISLRNESLLFIFASIFFWLTFTQYIPWYLLPTLILACIYLARIVLQTRDRVILLFVFLACAIFASSFAVRQLSVRLQYPTLYEAQEKSDYDHISIARYINDNATEGIIWNTGSAPNNYFINGFESKIIFDFYLFNFYSLSDSKNDGVIMDKLADLNVKYFLFKGLKNEYYSDILDAAFRNRANSPVTAENFIDAHMQFFEFRKNHLKLLKQEGDYYLYKLQ